MTNTIKHVLLDVKSGASEAEYKAKQEEIAEQANL